MSCPRKEAGGGPPRMGNLTPRKPDGGPPPFPYCGTKKVTPKKKVAAPAKSGLISQGPPDNRLKSGAKLPEGWIKQIYQRRNSAINKGKQDCYWITPGKLFKLRSMVEVEKFLAALKAADGDETKAKQTMKNH